MPLTAPERALFTAEQLAELDRMTPSRQDDFLEPPGTPPENVAAVRAKVVGSWANQNAPQLKVRVNIDSFGSPPAYSIDNNYTVDEQDAINRSWRNNKGLKANQFIPQVLSDLDEMEADFSSGGGFGVTQRSLLKKWFTRAIGE